MTGLTVLSPLTNASPQFHRTPVMAKTEVDFLPHLSSVEMDRRAAAVHDADAIMALEGFVKTPEMRALDEAFVEGRVTMTEKLEFVVLGSRLAGARSRLQMFPHGDERRLRIESEMTSMQIAYREMANSFGPAVARAYGFV